MAMRTPSATTSPSLTAPSALLGPKIPRSRLIGGYTMTHKTVEKWAARLCRVEELDPSISRFATQYINRHIKQYNARIRPVGEEITGYCMIVTQMAPFRGYKDMPSSEIPPFVPGPREKLAYDLLLLEGVEAEDIEFQTWLD